MSHGPDFWLSPAQAVYFLITGKNIAEVANLPDDLVIGTLARIPSTVVPLSAEPGSEELAAAHKEIRERLANAGENPCARAMEWRDNLLAAGLLAAEGKRTPSSPYETIKPVEFRGLRVGGPHAVNARGDVVFYDLLISGLGLWRARQEATIAQYEGAASQQRRADPASASGRVPPGRGGRKKGSGSKDDDATLREMVNLLANGQAHSVHDAAGKVAITAGDSHSRDADRARLRKKFRDKYGTEPPEGKTWRDVAGELNAN